MSKTRKKIISRLLPIAEKSKLKYKHAAALCSGNKILWSSVNSCRTKFGKNMYPCGHSEANCVFGYFNLQKNRCMPIDKLKRKANKLSIYVVRWRKKDGPANSEPCKHCSDIIKKYGIKKIKYLGKFSNLVEINTKDYHTDYLSSPFR